MTNEEQPATPQEDHEQQVPPTPPAPAEDESVAGTIMEGLTPQQVKGIMALLSEPTITRAASSIGVIALCQETMGIIEEAVKDHPDRAALLADQPRLYAAMDLPFLQRLIHCVEALHARVDQLRKKPEPTKPARATRSE
jgi:hypothetical protein